MNKLSLAPVALLLTLAVAACSLLVNADRTKVKDDLYQPTPVPDAGPGDAGSEGGAAGAAGAAGTIESGGAAENAGASGAADSGGTAGADAAGASGAAG